MKKSVLITGGSRGIGADTVRLFAASGYDAAFFYRSSEETARKIGAETGAIPIRCDVSDAQQVRKGVKDAKTCLGVSAFDTVILNAGVSLNGLFTDLTDEQWDELLGVNLSGMVYVIREVLPAMISRKAGQLILISSIWGQSGASCEAAYSATKAAAIGLAKGLAKEVGPSGIRVNVIAPGVIDTQMNRCYGEETMRSLAEETPLERLGTGRDVAGAALFLASDEASFITGQVLGVNGGMYI